MTNKEFKNKYGIKNYLDIKNNMEQKLYMLKYYKIINGYKFNKTKDIISLYLNKEKLDIEIVKLWYTKDENIKLLFNKKENKIKEIVANE